MVLLGTLERRGADQQRFLLKGGVAIELRLKLRARTTKDVDIIVLPDHDADILDALEDALAQPYASVRQRPDLPCEPAVVEIAAPEVGRPDTAVA